MAQQPRPFKRSLKERISDNWIFALPVIGAIGGASAGVFYGVTALALPTIGAAGLAVAGAVSGAIGVTAIGLGAYAAGHTIWKNKEYIALGAMFSVALAGKMLSYPFTKGWELLKKPFSRGKKPNAAGPNNAVPAAPESTKLDAAVAKDGFNDTADKPAAAKEAKNDNAPQAPKKSANAGHKP